MILHESQQDAVNNKKNNNKILFCLNYTFIFQLDAVISQIYFWNKILHVSDSSSVHHQEIFTVHTGMVYAIQVCWQLASKLSANL